MQLTLRGLIELVDWEGAREMGFLPPRVDFVTADNLEAKRQEEERERDQPRQAQRTRTA